MKANAQSVELLIWELRRAFRELAAAADVEFQAHGIQARDRAFLEFLAREQGPVSLSGLARKYSVSRQHMQQTLRRLSRSEWIEESPDPADGRAIQLRLSRKGCAAWEKIRAVDRAFLKRLAARLSEERVTAATELLKQLRLELQSLEVQIREEKGHEGN